MMFNLWFYWISSWLLLLLYFYYWFCSWSWFGFLRLDCFLLICVWLVCVGDWLISAGACLSTLRLLFYFRHLMHLLFFGFFLIQSYWSLFCKIIISIVINFASREYFSITLCISFSILDKVLVFHRISDLALNFIRYKIKFCRISQKYSIRFWAISNFLYNSLTQFEFNYTKFLLLNCKIIRKQINSFVISKAITNSRSSIN